MSSNEEIGEISIGYDWYTMEDRTIKVQIAEFEGRVGLDIRIYTCFGQGTPWPTIKGIRVPIKQAEELLDIVAKARTAIKRLQEPERTDDSIVL